MNKKGFTLVELLASLVILGVIIVIIVHVSSGTLATSSLQIDRISDNHIFDAARSYVMEQSVTFNDDGYVCVSVNDLISYGYFDNTIEDNLKSKIIKVSRNNTTKVIESIYYVNGCN